MAASASTSGGSEIVVGVICAGLALANYRFGPIFKGTPGSTVRRIGGTLALAIFAALFLVNGLDRVLR